MENRCGSNSIKNKIYDKNELKNELNCFILIDNDNHLHLMLIEKYDGDENQ